MAIPNVLVLLVWRQQLRHWHVVAQRSELLSLQHQTVEMAQGKQNRPRSRKFGIFGPFQETCDPEIPSIAAGPPEIEKGKVFQNKKCATHAFPSSLT